MKNNTDEKVDISSVNKTKKVPIISQLSSKTHQKNKSTGPGRDEIGRFTSGSGGAIKSPALNLGRVAPIVVLIALIGGFLVFTSNAATTSSAKITEWYNTCHGRAPDAGGLEYWKGRLDKGEDENGVFAAFVAAGGCNPKPKSTTATQSSPASPKPSIDQPAKDPISGLDNNARLEDDKLHQISGRVKSAFKQVFGVSPTPRQLSDWIDRAKDEDMSYNQLVSAMKSTSEYSKAAARTYVAADYDGLTDEEFVTKVYHQLWGHLSTPEDIKGKAKQIKDGVYTREQIFREIAARGASVATTNKEERVANNPGSQEAIDKKNKDTFFKMIADMILSSLPSDKCVKTADYYRRGIAGAWTMLECAGAAGYPPITGTDVTIALGKYDRGELGSLEEALSDLLGDVAKNPMLNGCSNSDTECQKNNFRDFIFCRDEYKELASCGGTRQIEQRGKKSTEYITGVNPDDIIKNNQRIKDQMQDKKSQSSKTSDQTKSISKEEQQSQYSKVISDSVKTKAKKILDNDENSSEDNRPSNIANDTYAEISELEGDAIDAMVIPECHDNTVLKKGDNGQCVKSAQSMMNIIEDSSIKITGTYDSNFVSKIKKYQASHLIKPSGKVDKQTSTRLKAGMDTSKYRSPMSPSRGFVASYRKIK